MSEAEKDAQLQRLAFHLKLRQRTSQRYLKFSDVSTFPKISRFHHQPDDIHPPESKLEAASHKADTAIQDIVNLLAAA